MKYFREIVFPQTPKPVKETVVTPSDIKNRVIFETVFCSKKRMWISMIECIDCSLAERSLEEILEDLEGC